MRGPKTLPGPATVRVHIEPPKPPSWPMGVDPDDPRCPDCRYLLWTPGEKCPEGHMETKGETNEHL